jgi:phage tail tube protein FII
MALRKKIDKFEKVFNTGIYPHLITSIFEEDFLAFSGKLSDKDLHSVFANEYFQKLQKIDLDFIRIESTGGHTVIRLGKITSGKTSTRAGTTKVTYAIDHRDLNVYNSEYDI